MRGEHCTCCPHYRKSWKVGPAPLLDGWFIAKAPTDAVAPTQVFRTEERAVEYARYCRDNPQVCYPGSKIAGVDFMSALYVESAMQQMKEEAGS